MDDDEVLRPLSLNGVFQRLTDETLVRNSCLSGRGSHRIQQLPGQAHVDSFTLGLKLKADRPHLRQVVSGEIGLLAELFGFFIASEVWQVSLS